MSIKNLIITGKTGCGKTFFSISEAKKLGKFAYLAPCRQLCYEIYIDYGFVDVDTLSTGEVKMGTGGNLFAVYESIRLEDLKNNYQTLIIDEAHFLTDEDRGGHLFDLIEEAKKLEINIFLVTATKNFSKLRGFELVELQPIKKPPLFKKINYNEYCNRRAIGVATIQFLKYSSNADLSADTLPSDRLQIQLDFRSGKKTFITSTNVLAQGINMPCENMLIEYNAYDSEELLLQKLGRLGRLGFSNSDIVTYCYYEKKSDLKIKNKKINKKKKSRVVTLEETSNGLNWHGVTCQDFEIPKKFILEYKFIKYSKPFFEDCKRVYKEFTKYQQDFVDSALNILDIESEKIKKIIRQNKKQ
jgi:late competence protein required for DNA uptake (superfamily II DNA/RNA helicase)